MNFKDLIDSKRVEKAAEREKAVQAASRAAADRRKEAIAQMKAELRNVLDESWNMNCLGCGTPFAVMEFDGRVQGRSDRLKLMLIRSTTSSLYGLRVLRASTMDCLKSYQWLDGENLTPRDLVSHISEFL